MTQLTQPIDYRPVATPSRVSDRLVAFWRSLTLPQAVLILGALCVAAYAFASWPARYTYHWEGHNAYRVDRSTGAVQHSFAGGAWK